MKLWLSLGLVFSFSVVALGQESIPEVLVGRAAPDFAMTGIDGQAVKLSEVLTGGKHVVLLFDRAHW